MSVIPDIAFQQAIMSGFRRLREQPKFVELLFPDLEQIHLTQMREFLLNNSISFKANYPRAEELVTPCIIMQMYNEQEDATFLGNVVGMGGYEVAGQRHITDTLYGQGGSITDEQGLPKKLLGDVEALLSREENEGSTRIFWNPDFDEDMVDVFAGLSVPLNLHVTKGRGAGQVFPIIRFNPNSLDLDGVLGVNLDNTSLFDIRLASLDSSVTGQPSRVYTNEDSVLLQRVGANFKATYQFSVIGGSQLETVFLFSILKSILYSQSVVLEKGGIQALELSGSEFSPKTEYLPTQVFQRTLTAKFVYTFSTVIETPVFREIDAAIFPTVVGEHTSFTRIEFDLDL